MGLALSNLSEHSTSSQQYFSGDALSRNRSDGSNLYGRILYLKATLPQKSSPHTTTPQIPVVRTCRVVSNHAGIVLSGRPSQSNDTQLISHVDIASQYEEAAGCALNRITIPDPRASQLLLIPQPGLNRWWIVSARQPFTRHSGTCLVLGDDKESGRKHRIRIGDFIRLGSVGLLVTETHDGTTHAAISEQELNELTMEKKDVLEELFNGDIDAHFAEMFIGGRYCVNSIAYDFAQRQHPIRSGQQHCSNDTVPDQEMSTSINSGPFPPISPTTIDGNGVDEEPLLKEPSLCYICFDSEDTDENPLVAPCKCSGSTKYIHVECLQSWYSSKGSNRPCIVSDKKGTQVCTICKAPYKTHLLSSDGRVILLLKPKLQPPYICFTVYTRHQHHEELFSTRFHVSFKSIVDRNNNSTRSITIGRSATADMVLDYRTVSTVHASVTFESSKFYIQDLHSSNGTFLFLREPLQLRVGDEVQLRWGKGSITIRASCSSSQSSGFHGLCASSASVNVVDTRRPDCQLSYDLLRNLASYVPPSHSSLMDTFLRDGTTHELIPGSIATQHETDHIDRSAAAQHSEIERESREQSAHNNNNETERRASVEMNESDFIVDGQGHGVAL